MDLVVTFPGNKKVDATIGDFTIKTDQLKKAGGDQSAPPPFSLFLASIGTCSGVYVVYFCQKRDIPYEDIRIIQKTRKNPETKMIEKITISVELPPDFPDKYKKPLLHAVDLCAVKKHIMDPPEFELETVTRE